MNKPWCKTNIVSPCTPCRSYIGGGGGSWISCAPDGCHRQATRGAAHKGAGRGGDRSDQTPVLDCRVDMARVSSRPGAEGRKGGRAGPARPGMGEPDPPCARPLAWVRRTGETRGGLQPGGRSARRAGRPYRWFRGRLGGRGGACGTLLYVGPYGGGLPPDPERE